LSCPRHSTYVVFLTICLAGLEKQAWLSSGAGTKPLIINAVGQDRLGIVSDITGMVISCGGNVGESSAAKLGAHFSLMMLVEVPQEQMVNLTAQLQSMPDMNAAVFESNLDGTTKLTPQIACTFPLAGVKTRNHYADFHLKT
jgi:predicted amino acid-binding ACT domain protein